MFKKWGREKAIRPTAQHVHPRPPPHIAYCQPSPFFCLASVSSVLTPPPPPTHPPPPLPPISIDLVLFCLSTPPHAVCVVFCRVSCFPYWWYINRDVTDATQFLLTVLVPSTAHLLCSMPPATLAKVRHATNKKYSTVWCPMVSLDLECARFVSVTCSCCQSEFFL